MDLLVEIREMTRAGEVLANAADYLAKRFSARSAPQERRANLDARELILGCQVQLFADYEHLQRLLETAGRAGNC